MRHITLSFCLTLAMSLLATSSLASDFQDMDICLGRQMVARTLCKDPNEVNFVSKVRDNINLFSVFYAKKETHFFVGVYNDMIRVQGREFHKVTRSVPYHFDSMAKCAVVEYSPADCINNERIVCCSEKTVEEQLDDKFWNRPIPELLEEDLRNAIGGSNATQPATPEEQQAQ